VVFRPGIPHRNTTQTASTSTAASPAPPGRGLDQAPAAVWPGRVFTVTKFDRFARNMARARICALWYSIVRPRPASTRGSAHPAPTQPAPRGPWLATTE